MYIWNQGKPSLKGDIIMSSEEFINFYEEQIAFAKRQVEWYSIQIKWYGNMIKKRKIWFWIKSWGWKDEKGA